MSFSIITAADEKFGIGKDNGLPWQLPGDLKYFSRTTTEASEGKMNAVIMGRKTWESIPPAHRPLKGRLNIVLSRSGNVDAPEDVLVMESLDEALLQMKVRRDIEKIFVIGGANVYAQAVLHPDVARIYLTAIQGLFECDAFFPDVSEDDWKLISQSENYEENGVQYHFCVYERVE